MAVTIRTLLVAGLVLSAEYAEAQITFIRNGGTVTGGGRLQIGGAITGNGRYVTMGVNATTSQLIGIQNFPFFTGGGGNTGFGNGGFGNNGFGNGGFGNGGGSGFQGNGNAQASAGPKPTVAQFVKNAITFDADKNGKLDQEELGTVAAAILAELKQRGRKQPAAGSETADEKDTEPDPAQKKLIDTFVKRSMKFDSNKDKSLNREETKKLAIVFIRSMT